MKQILLAITFLIVTSCSKNDYETIDYVTKNEQEITDYIATNNLTATRSNSGLYYVITEEGTGAQPTATSTVTVAYKGSFINGQLFDKSTDAGISFSLQRVIRGWTEGITYFKEGGKGLLLIPSHLAYGSYNYNGIPGGSVLIFEIHLISIN
ncbi:FKBP-type peptidyl-prolyl cis-trans isomerase [Flavobacterium sp. NG2]|uniref:FKBP-type peptidyl-prolyl cis-trans isomerase n=1 Tax=Flavobacterium sp. NG2 TaxID=3097547 RepID=UPI002A81BFF8|nr:FKBP-type peptidyl-prolyl cis-trans isomerase [Flavobacterium sp. NG2]WPR72208.1 FKBP-type peptidyl-prolyl cis-trans isomerase [Flavobacterium sp. NG2]